VKIVLAGCGATESCAEYTVVSTRLQRIGAREQRDLIPFLLEGVGHRELNQQDLVIQPSGTSDHRGPVWRTLEPILRQS
jgi:hypothetical protein